MKPNVAWIALSAAACLSGCGGRTPTDTPPPIPGSALLAQTSSATAVFSGNRNNYTVTRTTTGYVVKDNAGADGIRSLDGVQRLQFADVAVNLTIGSNANSINAADLQTIIELYIAFFNRVPDADGLSYWIDQFKGGRSIDLIADSFYDAAIQSSSLTGYSATMTNADFVRIVYKNVLGRTGSTAPSDEEVAYWAGELANGNKTRGSLIKFMLGSAHSFLGDATWGWVAQLLDNKLTVAKSFAVQHGLNYLGDTDNLTKTMAIAAAVTPTDTAAALALVGMTDTDFNLAVTVAALSGPTNVPACGLDIAEPLFGTSPVAVDDFIAFRPLGFLSTPVHMFPAKHSAFSMTPIGATPVPKPVVAPGKGYVTEIYEASFSTGGKNYQVFFRPCRDVRVYFGHLATISDKLLNAFNAAASNCNSFSDSSATVTTCRRENMAIELSEGEQLGTGPDTAGVDFGVLDFRRWPAAFVNLSHYDTYYPYYTSPLNYFSTATRQAIEAKTGNVFGTRWRTTAPVGGSHMEDIAGTAQGNWFLPGKYHSNTTDLSIFLGLVHDYVDPSQPIMAVGTTITGMTMGLYSYTVAASGTINRDFSAIKADGKTYCFDNFLQGQSAGSMPLTKPSGIVLMTMPTATSLKVEFVAGNSCAATANWTFSAGATIFER